MVNKLSSEIVKKIAKLNKKAKFYNKANNYAIEKGFYGVYFIENIKDYEVYGWLTAEDEVCIPTINSDTCIYVNEIEIKQKY